MGVKHLAVLSTGEMIENPKHARRHAKQTCVASGAARPAVSARIVAPVDNLPAGGCAPRNRSGQCTPASRTARRDHLHKLTTRLVRDFDTVVVEDLNIAGMTRSGGAYKRGLNRALHDAGLAEIRRQLTYKTEWTGTSLHVADRWYPSSKTCSSCQVVKIKLPLNVRVFTLRCVRLPRGS